jgi:hypothetical protein
MVPNTLTVGAILSGAVVACSAAAFAEPVTEADLAGKKICWDNGGIATYGKDGSYESNVNGHGTWRLVGDKLTEQGGGGYTFTITKKGDILHMSGVVETSGKVCD